MTASTAAEQLLYAHLGERLAVYVLNLSPEQVSRVHGDTSVPLTDLQSAVLEQLIAIDSQLASEGAHEEIVAMNWSRQLAARNEQTGTSVGNSARLLSGGSLPSPTGDQGELESTLSQLAIEAFPALLLKEPESRHGFGTPISLYDHPLNASFQAAVQADGTLSSLFTNEDPNSGPMGYTLRSTGHGGTLQLWIFAETLIHAGWRLAQSRTPEPTVDDFIGATLESLSTVRSAIAGEAITVPMLVGLTGVLLPEGTDRLDLGWGRLRRVLPQDAQYIRATSLEGQLTTTTPDGQNIAINYSGDTVLEIDAPYLVKVGEFDPTNPFPPDYTAAFQMIEEYLENVRLGLLLALPELKPIVISSWRTVLDPLTHGKATGWSDVTRTPKLMPIQLTTDQAKGWQEWAKRVGELRIPTIGVAVRRILAAAAERNSPDDVLVDAVIVWENLFGARTETTLRVTSSLAWLLGDSAEDRRARQLRYKKIYASRSDVVHGSAAVRPEEIQEYSVEAVNTSIDALRALFTSRVDLLDVKTSEERSLEILHKG